MRRYVHLVVTRPALWSLVLAPLIAGGCNCFELFPDCSSACEDYVVTANARGGPYCNDGGCYECEEDWQCATACNDDGRCLFCDDNTPCRESYEACVDSVCRACLSDTECGAGRLCLEGRCGAACTDDEACGLAVIDALKALNSPTLPTSQFGCRAHDDFAEHGFGAIMCTGQGYGASRLVCDVCLADLVAGGCPDCLPTGDCPCGASSDCPGGLVCRGGACGSCSAHRECSDGEYCAKGYCQANCTNDAECPGGRCDDEGHCRGCLEDSDCPAGDRCYRDGCVAPCSSAEDCPLGGCQENGRCGGCN